MLKVIFVTFVLKGEVKQPTRGISASRLARNKIPTATHVSGVKLFNGAINNTYS